MSDPWEEVDCPCGIYCTKQCMLISNYVNIKFSVQMSFSSAGVLVHVHMKVEADFAQLPSASHY